MNEVRIQTAQTHSLAVLLILLLFFPGFAARAQENHSNGALSPKIANLIYQLQDDNPGRRYQAAAALIQLKPMPPEALDRMFKYPVDPSVQKAFEDAGPQALPIVTGAIRGSDQQLIRRTAVNLLGAMARRWPALWPDLVDMLKSEDPVVRMDASFQFFKLSEVNQKVVIPLLRGALRDNDSRTRLAALETVSNVDPLKREATPEIAMLLKDSDPRIRSTAAVTLARIWPPPKSATGSLLDALKDPVREVRQNAAFALIQIDPHHREIVPVWIDVLAHGDTFTTNPDPYFRGIIVNAFGAMGTDAREAAPALEHLLATDPDASVRIAVGSTLANVVGAKSAALPLGQALTNDKDVQVRKEAIKWIRNLGDDGAPAIPALIKSLRDSNADVRTGAIENLGFLGKLAVPPLIAALQDPDLNIREGAVQALAMNQPLPDDAVRALTARAFKDQNRSVRNDAAKVLQNANIKAGTEALAQLAKESPPASRPARTDDKNGRYTREEIIATIPADAEHAYPMRLMSLLPMGDDHEPSAAEILVSLHHGSDRPDRLAIWKKAGENQYRLVQLMTTDEDLTDEHFAAPTVFTPRGQPPFLEIEKVGWRYSDDSLFALDLEAGELHPVEIESAESWYRPKLGPGEEISYHRDIFADDQEPGFVIHLKNKKDPVCCPTDAQVIGTYKIVEDSKPSDGRDTSSVITWKFVPFTAARKPLPPHEAILQ